MRRNPLIFTAIWTVIGLGLAPGIAPRTIAWAGGDSSGGGDSKTRDPGNAWFVGRDKRIRACLEVAPGFGADRAFAVRQIERAFDTWESYLRRKLDDRDPALTPASRVELVASCEGADLAFYLGVENARTREAALAYQDPTAMAHRLSYDMEKAWGSGFVWVKPWAGWTARDNLLAVLLHEIGHALGNDHVPGTIMDGDIASKFRNLYGPYEGPNDASRIELTQIDQRHELVLCKACETAQHGIVSMFTRTPLKNTDYDPEEVRRYGLRFAEETFLLLTGREPRGKLFTRWTYLPAADRLLDSDRSSLFLRDDAGEVEFQLRLAPKMAVDFVELFGGDSHPRAFHVNTSGTFFPTMRPGGKSETLPGWIRAHDGKELPILIERNTRFPGPIRILYLDAGRAHELMLSVYSGANIFDPYRD